MRTLGGKVARGRWRWSAVGRSPTESLAVGGVAVLSRCTASGPGGEACGLERPIFRRGVCQVVAGRASVVSRRQSLLLAVGCRRCCHRCCRSQLILMSPPRARELSGWRKKAAADPGCAASSSRWLVRVAGADAPGVEGVTPLPRRVVYEFVGHDHTVPFFTIDLADPLDDAASSSPITNAHPYGGVARGGAALFP